MNNMESRLLAVTIFLKEILEINLSCHIILELTMGWIE
jgi:hypothetical protein